MQPRLEVRHRPRAQLAETAGVAGAYQEHVALANGDALLSLGRLEVVAEDVLAGLEPAQSAETGNVEQDAPPDQSVPEDLDRFGLRASGSHGVHGRPVVEKPLVGDVAERVDVRVAVVVVVGAHEVHGEPQRPRPVVVVLFGGHEVNCGDGIVRCGRGVQWQAQRHAGALAHEAGGRGDPLGHEPIQRPTLIALAPSPPGTHAAKDLAELVGGHLDGRATRLRHWALEEICPTATPFCRIRRQARRRTR